jgi:hypothetical protein
VHNHLTGDAHGLRISRKVVHDAIAQRNLAVVADNEAVKPPSGRIAPIPWLAKETTGMACTLCTYCSKNEPAMARHWQTDHQGRRDGRNLKDICRAVSMQRFFTNGLSSKYFEVQPVLRGSSEDGAFTRFYNSLPDSWRNGDFTSQSTLDGKPGEFDLPPFLAKTGWVAALRGCSIANLRAKVSASKPAEKPYLHSISGLGKEFLTSIKDLNHVHPIILEGLTKWRSYS